MSLPNKLAQGRPIQVWINRQSGSTDAVPTTVLANNTGGTISAIDTSITVASVANLPTAGFFADWFRNNQLSKYCR